MLMLPSWNKRQTRESLDSKLAWSIQQQNRKACLTRWKIRTDTKGLHAETWAQTYRNRGRKERRKAWRNCGKCGPECTQAFLYPSAPSKMLQPGSSHSSSLGLSIRKALPQVCVCSRVSTYPKLQSCSRADFSVTKESQEWGWVPFHSRRDFLKGQSWGSKPWGPSIPTD